MYTLCHLPDDVFPENNLFLKMSFQPFYLTDCQLIVSEIWRTETMLRFSLKGSFKNFVIVNTNDFLKSTFSICQFEVSFEKKGFITF